VKEDSGSGSGSDHDHDHSHKKNKNKSKSKSRSRGSESESDSGSESESESESDSDSESDSESTHKHKRAKRRSRRSRSKKHSSSESDESDSDGRRASRRRSRHRSRSRSSDDRKHKKKNSEKKKKKKHSSRHSRHRRKKRSRNSSSREHRRHGRGDRSDSSDSERSDREDGKKRHSRKRARSKSVDMDAQPAATAGGSALPSDLDDDSQWVEKEVPVPVGKQIGPAPIPEAAVGGRVDYGGALLPGEGSAMARFAEENKRIPRRGEVGLTSEDIEQYEELGYVMSGSRHRRMEAVRTRKEGQVLSAIEQRQLALLNAEERAKKENKILADFREIITTKQKGLKGKK